MRVHTDDGRSVAFDLKDYAHIDHGYAATIHKAQGMTVDRTHVLATPGLDRHATYVALSRHRSKVDLHYGENDFADRDRLVRTLSRERAKDMASDYERIDPVQSFAEQRGVTRSRILDTLGNEQLVDPSHSALPLTRRAAIELARTATSEPKSDLSKSRRGRFDGLRLNAGHHIGTAEQGSNTIPPEPHDQARGRFDGMKLGTAMPRVSADPNAGLGKAVERYARSLADIARMSEQGLPSLEHQKVARQAAARALDLIQAHGGQDCATAFAREPGLVGEAANGQTGNVIRAMQLQADLRTNSELRADRFVSEWQARARQSKALERTCELGAAAKQRTMLAGIAKSLERDP